MTLRYTRKGGFIGVSQTLTVREGVLRLEDRRAGAVERALTEEERSTLEQLLTGAKGTPAPQPASAPRVRDGFEVAVSLEDGDAVDYRQAVFALPVTGGSDTAWGALVAFLDGLVEAARSASPAGSHILGSKALLDP